jgi:NAD(P)-dependent dehydrogenase (short-subunit alcohol dehydrogenase family)
MTRWLHAIVTGGSSGIGKETARLLVRRGASVTLLARGQTCSTRRERSWCPTAPARHSGCSRYR